MKSVETSNAFNYIATLLGMENGIDQVMNIMADFLFDCFKTPKYSEERQSIVSQLVLENLNRYIKTPITCKLLAKTDKLQTLFTSTQSHEDVFIPILSKSDNLKQLGYFYKILMQLWLYDDSSNTFE